MNNKLKNLISLWTPVIFWCLIIFLFSTAPKISIGKDFWTDFVFKKTAHLIEYAILGIFTYRAFKKNKFKTLTFILFYATTDEIHQAFVPGRESRTRDVIIDLIGGYLGIWLIKYLPPEVQKKLDI